MSKRTNLIIKTIKYNQSYVAIIIVAIVGSFLLLVSNAATPYAQTELENARLAGGATEIPVINSSGGSAVVFNSTTNPPSVNPKLTWAPPGYPNYTGYNYVNVTNSAKSLKLDKTKDYVVKMPSQVVPGRVTISGGRNVVLIGGEIRASSLNQTGEIWNQYSNGTVVVPRQGIYVTDWTGTMHLEGIKFTGELEDSIRTGNSNIGASLQIQNIWVEKNLGWAKSVDGSNGPHADVIQTWCGPDKELRIDRVTAKDAGYQGLQLNSDDVCNTVNTDVTTIKNVQIEYLEVNPYAQGTFGSYYFWFQQPIEDKLIVENVWGLPNPSKSGSRDNWLWPRPSTDILNRWTNVKQGVPPVDIVDENLVGIEYISPGYN